ncbi:MAG TPA: 2OG-Fe(II) oxygenase [Pseudomonadales bacterium]
MHDTDALADVIAAALATQGYCIVDDALPPALAKDLASACAAAPPAAFRAAGIGRRESRQHDSTVRSDAIRWLDAAVDPDALYLQATETLRASLNRKLFLGLFDYECHYARYAPGACYRRHVDAFAGQKNRVLSTVLYLNPDWREGEGGELVLYEGDAAEALQRVLPLFNRLVVFLSERFPHEVLPATRARHSIAGWFRVRS